MGLLDKIENKIVGNSAKHEAESKLKQGTSSTAGAGGENSSTLNSGKTAMENMATGRPYNSSGKVGEYESQAGGAGGMAGLGGASGASRATGASGATGPTGAINDLRHPVQAMESQGLPSHGSGSGYGDSAVRNNPVSGGQGGSTGHQVGSAAALGGTGGYGSNDPYSSQGQKTRPIEPYDPYSSRGQQTAAAAAAPVGGTSRYNTGHSDTQDYASGNRRSVEDPSDVTRSRHGGVTNSMEEQRFNSGQHSSLENRSAVPTAGGEKLGSGAADSSVSQHHYGRDAALAGGAGAAGLGGYEVARDRNQTGQSSAYSANTSTTSGRSYDQPGTGVNSDNVSYMNRSAAGPQYGEESRGSHEMSGMAPGAAAAGYAGAGAGAGAMSNAEPHHHHHHHHQHQGQQQGGIASQRDETSGMKGLSLGNSTGGQSMQGSGGAYSSPNNPGTNNPQLSSGTTATSSAISIEKKLGSAYEAGYRDAMAHMEAERARQQGQQ